MQCGGCGTLLDEGQLTCPNCGRTVWSRGAAKGKAAPAKPGSGLASARSSAPNVEELELSEPAGDGVTPGPEQVKALLASEPDLLEKGLALLQDKNQDVGADYATDVGSIDVLARDAKGVLVVVMVAKGDASDVVGEMLRRIGWVRKHLARGNESVRGIVVMDRVPDDLSYTAAAVSDTVAFRTYRMTLAFDPVVL